MLQWQPLVLPSYRGDSRAVFVVGPAGRHLSVSCCHVPCVVMGHLELFIRTDQDICCTDGTCAQTMHGTGRRVGRWPVNQLGRGPCDKHLRKVRELGFVCSIGQPTAKE